MAPRSWPSSPGFAITIRCFFAIRGGKCSASHNLLVSARRVRFRPPGVKTGSTIGPLGPFRGTLGIQWVIASIAAGLVIVLVISWLLFREPGAPFEKVEEFTIEEVRPGTAREAFAGVYVARTEAGDVYAVTEPANCPLEIIEDGFLDCTERRYGLDGRGRKGRALSRLPVRVRLGAIYIDLSAR